MFRATIIKGLIILLAIGVLVSLGWVGLKMVEKKMTEKKEELTLKDFPSLFKKKVMIIIGENATPIEIESVKQIAEKLKELTKTQPIVKKDNEVLEKDKINNNLIVVGTPTSNVILEQVYNLTKIAKVTAEYPGKNKGIIEILRNPWNSKRLLLIVAGSDEWGVKAGSEKLVNFKELEEEKSIIVDFTAAEVIIGITELEVIDVHSTLRKGKTVTNLIQIPRSAVFYSCRNMNYLAGVNIPPFELKENGKTQKTGISLPVFNVDIMVIDNIPPPTDTEEITGEIIGSFRNYPFSIGKSNYLSVEKNINPNKTIAVKVWVDLGIKNERNEYYLKIRAKKSGDCPVSVTIFGVPLYSTEWRHNLVYDPDVLFMPGSNSF